MPAPSGWLNGNLSNPSLPGKQFPVTLSHFFSLESTVYPATDEAFEHAGMKKSAIEEAYITDHLIMIDSIFANP